MKDEELISAIKNRNQQAFREFYDKYHLMIFRSCMGFVHQQEAAEEIVQDVFVEAYISIDKFKWNSKISTWLYRIAINKSLNHLRKEKTKNVIKNFETLWGTDKADEDNYKEQEQAGENIKKQLHHAIDKLPKNQRTAFILHKYDDLSYKEIAEIMHVSLSAVESLMHRAKKNLQNKLKDFYMNRKF